MEKNVKVVRNIWVNGDETRETISNYDRRGNLIYEKHSSGVEITNLYDQNNNLFYSKEGNCETFCYYDGKGKPIKRVCGNGDFETWEYDEDGNELEYCLNGITYLKRYDNEGRLVYSTNDSGSCYFHSYRGKTQIEHFYCGGELINTTWFNEDGKPTCFKEEGSAAEQRWKYSDDYVFFEDSEGFWEETIYSDGKKVGYKNSDGDKTIWEYDDDWNLVHYKANGDFAEEYWNSYSDGKLVKSWNSNEVTLINTYEDGKLVCSDYGSCGKTFYTYWD